MQSDVCLTFFFFFFLPTPSPKNSFLLQSLGQLPGSLVMPLGMILLENEGLIYGAKGSASAIMEPKQEVAPSSLVTISKVTRELEEREPSHGQPQHCVSLCENVFPLITTRGLRPTLSEIHQSTASLLTCGHDTCLL